MLSGSDMISADMEEVVALIVGWEEALRLAGRFELLHLPRSSARRLVRILGGVIQSFVMAMFDDAIQILPKMLD